MKRCKDLYFFASCALFFLLGGCALSQDGRDEVDSAQVGSEFRELKVHTATFTLYSLLRPARGGSTNLRVYIEGDGLAWLTRTRPSDDPTPTKAISLRMAQQDPSADAVMYLARPCQYVTDADTRMCSRQYWTSHRFAPEVISATNEAISIAKRRAGAQTVSIIGFSGGGGLAVLAAAQRSDVHFIGSVAGNLDHALWTNVHNVTPLKGSQNPIDVASKVQHIPQRHMSSIDDDIVPPRISQAFCRAIQRPESCIVISDVTHEGAWKNVWDYRYP